MKYKLLENETLHEVHCRALRTLYRIIAMEDFNDVHKGDKGGFVENYDNLSQSDNSWVYDNAKVCGGAKVYGNAQIRNTATVYGRTLIHGNAKVFDNANVGFDPRFYPKNSIVEIYGNAQVYDNSRVDAGSKICGNAKVFGNACVSPDLNRYYCSEVRGSAQVYGDATLVGTVAFGNVQVCGKTRLTMDHVCNNKTENVLSL